VAFPRILPWNRGDRGAVGSRALAVGAAPSWRRRWGGRLALATLLAVAIAYFPYQLLDGSGARRSAELADELRRTRASVAELDRANAALRLTIDALKNDPEAIVDIARDELGMVRPGELVIRLEGLERPAREAR
jgi:cell division protein FtsB